MKDNLKIEINYIIYNLFDGPELDMLRKCVVFYSAIGARHPSEEFALENIKMLSKRSITTDLYLVLRHGEVIMVKGKLSQKIAAINLKNIIYFIIVRHKYIYLSKLIFVKEI